MTHRILISSTDEASRTALSRRLEERGHDVIALAPGADWLGDILQSPVDLILVEEGDEVGRILALTSRTPPPHPWVFLRTRARIDWSRDPAEDALKASRGGHPGIAGWAPSYVSPDVLVPWLETTLENRRLVLRDAEVRRELGSRYSGRRLVGTSAAVRRLRTEALHLAVSNSPVALIGEPGSGRGFLARLLHFRGPRGDAPFAEFPCETLAQERVEEDLFGSDSPQRRRRGFLERTDGGTLYLKGLGRLPFAAQIQLADFLADRGRVDSAQTTPESGEDTNRSRREGVRDPLNTPDVRVVASFRRPLEVERSQGWLEPRLWNELRAHQIHVPSLRERVEDIPDLVRTHLEAIGAGTIQVTDETLAWLSEQSWPGNIAKLNRSLEQALGRRRSGDRLEVGDFRVGGVPPAPSETGPEPDANPRGKTAAPKTDSVTARDDGSEAQEDEGPAGEAAVQLPARGIRLAEVERDLIEQALARTHGNQSRAARLLGLSRQTLIYRMQKHGIR